MLKNIDLMTTAANMARHAASRQSVIAENIANADTPGYKAQDIEPFSAIFARTDSVAPRRIEIEASGVASPNGNTVSLEDQMWRSSKAARQHEIATTIYAKAISLLRAGLGGAG